MPLFPCRVLAYGSALSVGLILTFVGIDALATSTIQSQALAEARTTEVEILLARAEEKSRAATASEDGEAIQIYQEALLLFERQGDEVGQAATLRKIGEQQFSLGLTNRAIRSLERGLEIARRTPHALLHAAALEGLSGVYLALKNPTKALRLSQEAASLLPSEDISLLRAKILLHIAVAKELQGETQEAIERYLALLPMVSRLNFAAGEAGILNNLGTIHYGLGEYRKSVDFYRRAALAHQKSEDRQREAESLGNLGATLAVIGELEQALDTLDRALLLHQGSGNRRAEANTLNELGAIYLKQGEVAQAKEFSLKARTMAREVQAPRIEAFSQSQLGQLAANRKQDDLALDHFRQALNLVGIAGFDSDAANILVNISRVLDRQGKKSQARSAAEEAISIIESMRTRVTAHPLRTSFFSSRRSFYDYYIRLLMSLHKDRPDQGYEVAALQMAERARARSLLDQLSEAGTDITAGLDPELLRKEGGLRDQINRLERENYRLLASSEESRDFAGEAKKLETRQDGLLREYEEVQARIRFLSPRFAELSAPEPLDLKEIQEQVLDEESVLLQYSLGDDSSYFWVVTKNRIEAFELPPRMEIEAAALRLYRLLTARNENRSDKSPRAWRAAIQKADESIQRAAQEVGDLILEPAKTLLARHRILVVAEGMLQYLPFALLPTPGDGENRPLLYHHEVVILPSSSSLALLRRENLGRPRAGKTLAVVADPVFSKEDSRVMTRRHSREEVASVGDREIRGDSKVKRADARSFQRLRFSRFEAEAIASLAPREDYLLALDFDASRQLALEGHLDDYRLLHFATHAIANDDRPTLTGLVFSLVDEAGGEQEGFLRLHDIYKLRLKADLVTLSACETALGQEVRGEGLLGLTRGFMYAGVPRVVSSLWNVQDKATAELMKRFYSAMLGEGLRPAAALRQAQLSMLEDPRWKAPYFWSAFIFQGEWQ